MTLQLRDATILDAAGERVVPRLSVENGRLSFGESAPDARVIDASDLLVTPGFIDVHTHGGGGYDLHTTDPSNIQRYSEWAPGTGVTSFLLGVVGTVGGPPLRELQTAAEAIYEHKRGARPIGIHLEGPYINVARRGAHDPSWLRVPNVQEIKEVLAAADSNIRIITIAPELEGASEAIEYLVSAGVNVSIGHTDCGYDTALRAIQLGARHITHCFNAMPPLLHRAPGPLGAIIEHPQVRGELIADGVHVQKPAVRALVRALGAERTVVITDALSGAGAVDGTFTFNQQPAHIEGGVARLADGTITGSVLTMDQALRNVIDMAGTSRQDAVRMLTLNPAQAAGVGDHKGLIEEGYDADLCLLDTDLNLIATICEGEITYGEANLTNHT